MKGKQKVVWMLSFMVFWGSVFTPIQAEFYPSKETQESFQKLKNRVADYLAGSWCSKEKAFLIMDLIATEKPKVCVEIGVFTGSSFLPMAAALQYVKDGKAIGIDPWSNEEAIKHLPASDPNTKWWSQVDMGVVRKIFDKMVQDWDLTPFCHVIAESSENAFSHIESIDFIHFDGNFSEEGSMQDVVLYLPKVKSGGYILLSNVCLSVDNMQPKVESFFHLLDECEVVFELEGGNAYLLRKN
jgi:hypothetical protein